MEPPELIAARLEKLKKIRTKKDLAFPKVKHMKATFTDFAGKERPLVIRYYQVQGILHLVFQKRFLLGDDTGLGKCKPLTSLVLTDNGLVRLGDLAPKGQILSSDTFHYLDAPTMVWTGWKWASIRQYYCGGTKPTKKIVTKRGYETTGSFVHPVRVRRTEGEMFIPIQDVRVGDHACLDRSPCGDSLLKGFPVTDPPVPVPDPKSFPTHTNIDSVPDCMTPDLARLLGYIVAEGWTADRYHILITQHRGLNPETHDDIRNLCHRVFGWTGGDTLNKDTTINLSSVYLRTYLEGLGIGFGLSASKSVPWPIFHGTHESVRAFLQAFFDFGCSMGEGVLEVSSASETMLREIQILLLRFGIMASRSLKHVKSHPDNTYWRLAICGGDARLFGRVIGLITPRKQYALDNLATKKSNANLDVVPHAKKLVWDLRGEILIRSTKIGATDDRKGSGIKQFGVSFEKTLNNIQNGGRNPTYEFLQEMLRVAIQVGAHDTGAYKKVERICKSSFFYDPIKEIRDGVEPVADIEVDDPSHSFVADGFVNHNTIQAIGALCFIWETDPNRKAIVMTTKSATRQWVDEFTKFTQGVKVIICKGTAAQRKAAHKMYLEATGPTVIVMGYRSAVGDYTEIQEWQGHILIADECFSYHTPILLADGTTELIGKIVSQRMPVQVWSWNFETNQKEPKSVTNWFRKPLFLGRRKTATQLTFDFSGTILATENHALYSPDGTKKSIQWLIPGDKVAYISDMVPTEDQWQIMVGSLLGDSSLSFPQRSLIGLSCGHSIKQKRLLCFKRDVLKSLGVGDLEYEPKSKGYQLKDGSDKGYVRFRMHGNPAFSNFLRESHVYREGKKRVSAAWLDRIGPLGLAVWLADDGSMHSHLCNDGSTSYYLNFSTCSFTVEEHEIIVGWLKWKFGIGAEVVWSKARGSRKSYPSIRMSREASKRFFQIIPGAIPGVEYKFPEGMATVCLNQLDLQPKTGLVPDRILTKKRRNLNGAEVYVYDLEVADNHNYFANGVLASNCTAFKNPKTHVHQVCRHLGDNADRMWALTATMIKNHLMEGFGIYQVIHPGLFGMTERQFMLYYALTQKVPIGHNRYIDKIVGYLPQRIVEFRQVIDPYFLGRPKHEVATELPTLTSRTMEVELTGEQNTKYEEALEGMLEMVKDGNAHVQEVTKLTAISYCQEIVGHLGMIGIDDPESPKIDALVELVSEGDFADDKVIVFSRFEKMISLVMARLKKEGIPSVRVTGKENEDQRRAAMKAFQDPNSDTRVICITTAGSEAINLQAAKALVCLDTPWSAGDFLQLLGRMIRIGSEHDKCYVVHMVGRRSGTKKETIDHRIMEVLGEKMGLIEAVLGKRIKGEGDDVAIQVGNDISDLFASLRNDAKGDR